MKEARSALERLFETAPREYKVRKKQHTVAGYGGREGGEVTVTDSVGTKLLWAQVAPSNSGETCCIAIHRYVYYKEWDGLKVLSMVAYGFYAQACSKPVTTLEAQALRELRTNSVPLISIVPPAVTEVVRAVHELYQSTRGEDVARAWEEARKLMAKLSRKGATEEQLVKEWREVLVREVQES